ncbi:TRUB2 family protein [Megaselia abdita]
MNQILTYNAPTVFKRLNGIVKLLKPALKRVSHVKNAFLFNVCKDLNALNVRPPRQILLESGGAQNVVLRKVNDLSDHILAVGPRYQIKDIKCSVVNHLGEHTSGVLILGLNRCTKNANKLRKQRFIRTFHVKGLLGTSTENFFWDSRITCKSRFSHVTEDRFDSIVSSLQASHQRSMYDLCGVDIRSHAGYELASKGIIRPEINDQPLIYGIKIIEFKPPNFTLEIHVINENEEFLAMLVHDIAIELKSVAHCNGISCIRYGPFHIDNSLINRHWSLSGAVHSMNHCKNVLDINMNVND